jgi:diguanylate cyclase (GGDEF)-like protein/PAS domain S-box-containing protein
MSIEPTSARDVPADTGLVGLAVLRELPGTAVFVFDRDLRVRLATGAALAEHVWFCDAMEGRQLADVVPAESYRGLQTQFRRALEGESCAFDDQAPGDPRWFRVEVGPLRREGGPIVGGVVVSRDITAERHTEEALRASRSYLQDVLDCLSVPVSVKDADYRLVSLNREYSRLQQRDRAELVGKTVFDLFPDQFAQAFDDDDRRALRTGAPVTTEREVPQPDGSMRSYQLVRSPLRDSAGRIYGLVSVGTDVTAQRREAEALYEANERFEQTFQNAPIGNAICALDGRFIKVNRALCQLTGYTEAELLERTFQDLTHPDDLDADVAQAQQLLAGDIASYEMEKRYRRANGEPVWILLSVSLVRTAQDEPVQYIAQMQDISERRELERHLRQRAEHDALTGLRNRARFEEDLDQQLARCRRYGERAALLLLDLDDFKRLNDEYGHAGGDDALKHVAVTLNDCVRDSDIVGRWGGDEFVILAPHIDGAGARLLARQIAERLQGSSLRLGSQSTVVSASVGVTELGDGALTTDAALVAADASMYEAKRAGRRRR